MPRGSASQIKAGVKKAGTPKAVQKNKVTTAKKTVKSPVKKLTKSITSRSLSSPAARSKTVDLKLKKETDTPKKVKKKDPTEEKQKNLKSKGRASESNVKNRIKSTVNKQEIKTVTKKSDINKSNSNIPVRRGRKRKLEEIKSPNSNDKSKHITEMEERKLNKKAKASTEQSEVLHSKKSELNSSKSTNANKEDTEQSQKNTKRVTKILQKKDTRKPDDLPVSNEIIRQKTQKDSGGKAGGRKTRLTREKDKTSEEILAELAAIKASTNEKLSENQCNTEKNVVIRKTRQVLKQNEKSISTTRDETKVNESKLGGKKSATKVPEVTESEKHSGKELHVEPSVQKNKSARNFRRRVKESENEDSRDSILVSEESNSALHQDAKLETRVEEIEPTLKPSAEEKLLDSSIPKIKPRRNKTKSLKDSENENSSDSILVPGESITTSLEDSKLGEAKLKEAKSVTKVPVIKESKKIPEEKRDVEPGIRKTRSRVLRNRNALENVKESENEDSSDSRASELSENDSSSNFESKRKNRRTKLSILLAETNEVLSKSTAKETEKHIIVQSSQCSNDAISKDICDKIIRSETDRAEKPLHDILSNPVIRIKTTTESTVTLDTSKSDDHCSKENNKMAISDSHSDLTVTNVEDATKPSADINVKTDMIQELSSTERFSSLQTDTQTQEASDPSSSIVDDTEIKPEQDCTESDLLFQSDTHALKTSDSSGITDNETIVEPSQELSKVVDDKHKENIELSSPDKELVSENEQVSGIENRDLLSSPHNTPGMNISGTSVGVKCVSSISECGIGTFPSFKNLLISSTGEGTAEVNIRITDAGARLERLENCTVVTPKSLSNVSSSCNVDESIETSQTPTELPLEVAISVDDEADSSSSGQLVSVSPVYLNETIDKHAYVTHTETLDKTDSLDDTDNIKDLKKDDESLEDGYSSENESETGNIQKMPVVHSESAVSLCENEDDCNQENSTGVSSNTAALSSSQEKESEKENVQNISVIHSESAVSSNVNENYCNQENSSDISLNTTEQSSSQESEDRENQEKVICIKSSNVPGFNNNENEIDKKLSSVTVLPLFKGVSIRDAKGKCSPKEEECTNQEQKESYNSSKTNDPSQTETLLIENIPCDKNTKICKPMQSTTSSQSKVLVGVACIGSKHSESSHEVSMEFVNEVTSVSRHEKNNKTDLSEKTALKPDSISNYVEDKAKTSLLESVKINSDFSDSDEKNDNKNSDKSIEKECLETLKSADIVNIPALPNSMSKLAKESSCDSTQTFSKDSEKLGVKMESCIPTTSLIDLQFTDKVNVIDASSVEIRELENFCDETSCSSDKELKQKVLSPDINFNEKCSDSSSLKILSENYIKDSTANPSCKTEVNINLQDSGCFENGKDKNTMLESTQSSECKSDSFIKDIQTNLLEPSSDNLMSISKCEKENIGKLPICVPYSDQNCNEQTKEPTSEDLENVSTNQAKSSESENNSNVPDEVDGTSKGVGKEIDVLNNTFNDETTNQSSDELHLAKTQDKKISEKLDACIVTTEKSSDLAGRQDKESAQTTSQPVTEKDDSKSECNDDSFPKKVNISEDIKHSNTSSMSSTHEKEHCDTKELKKDKIEDNVPEKFEKDSSEESEKTLFFTENLNVTSKTAETSDVISELSQDNDSTSSTIIKEDIVPVLESDTKKPIVTGSTDESRKVLDKVSVEFVDVDLMQNKTADNSSTDETRKVLDEVSGKFVAVDSLSNVICSSDDTVNKPIKLLTANAELDCQSNLADRKNMKRKRSESDDCSARETRKGIKLVIRNDTSTTEETSIFKLAEPEQTQLIVNNPSVIPISEYSETVSSHENNAEGSTNDCKSVQNKEKTVLNPECEKKAESGKETKEIVKLTADNTAECSKPSSSKILPNKRKAADEADSKVVKKAATNSPPVREYLDQFVPFLLEGLLKIAYNRPEDPIQYLADWMIFNKDEAYKRIRVAR